jgi:hypothetical protein
VGELDTVFLDGVAIESLLGTRTGAEAPDALLGPAEVPLWIDLAAIQQQIGSAERPTEVAAAER